MFDIKNLSYEEKIDLLDSDEISSEDLEEISNDEKTHFYVALNKACSSDLLKKIFLNNDFRVKCNVLTNKNCPVELLDEVSNDNSKFGIVSSLLRFNVVMNENCPAYLLEILSKELPDYVKIHPNCPNYLKILLK